MKVIVLKSIGNLRHGEIENVADGYAKNFLIKNGYAKIASEENVKNLQKEMDKIKKEEEQITAKTQSLADKISGIKLEIQVKTGENDKLFGSITAKDIHKALETKGFDIDKHDIDTPHLKELGEHEIEVKLGHGITANISVNIIKE
ncbi:50S ribosomal protein L9 [bacterium CG2_30_37_16]|nr:MAG: 50S ribosomal protein L9 [bacterium CG2_30_37_16]PIP31087.1 MAG: 50S ribosomal protein L9 [bacterium (Candidatus Howlettbacteria) CG23_combo_of_CG06-09_8_20_14_all_37_9]PIX99899.1 MAG: 50S ribosomal protein L9 [bacterium (Candidatus Howlettbacteria) CG_4_10_14_3_um_filter_37_10]PJB05790.1 MAG: 50S ribosomal protein L9 [bacterium (Candidatus Howlettbacteria) CG_4_9_14_3_um_filter_37_10]